MQNKALKVQSSINERIRNFKLSNPNKGNDYDDDDDDEDDEKHEEQDSYTLHVKRDSTASIKKGVRWSDGNLNEDEYSSEDSSRDSVDDGEEKTNVIYIKHTKIDSYNELKMESFVRYDQNEVVLQTPGDIYKVFHKPKSILKVQNSFENFSCENKMKNENETLLDDDCATSVTSKFDFQPLKVI